MRKCNLSKDVEISLYVVVRDTYSLPHLLLVALSDIMPQSFILRKLLDLCVEI